MSASFCVCVCVCVCARASLFFFFSLSFSFIFCFPLFLFRGITSKCGPPPLGAGPWACAHFAHRLIRHSFGPTSFGLFRRRNRLFVQISFLGKRKVNDSFCCHFTEAHQRHFQKRKWWGFNLPSWGEGVFSLQSGRGLTFQVGGV